MSELTEIEKDLQDASYALAVEIKLTQAWLIINGDVVCYKYLERRLAKLVPYILMSAAQRGAEPASVFHNYMRGVHRQLHKEQEND